MTERRNEFLQSVNELNHLIEKKKWYNVFLLSGKKSYYDSGASKLVEKLPFKNYSRFSDFQTNPLYEDLIKGLDNFNKNKYDAVFAIGGGSVIDMAKLILFFQSKKNLISYFSNQKNKDSFKKKIIPLVTIPTTAGAGSESTHFAVLYKDEKKYSVADRSLIPDYYLLLPELIANTSPYLTAVSGIDAFCQAIESYWSVNSTKISRKYAIDAIEILWNFLPIAVKEQDEEVRRNVLLAANYAGKAINISKTTAPHAISYTMTSKFGIPHGQAVCITLPHFLVYNYNVCENDLNDPRGTEFVKNKIIEIIHTINLESVDEAYIAIRNFINRLGLQTSLKSLLITEPHQIEEIKSNINFERLRNNPRKLNDSFIDQLFLEIG